MLFVVCEPLIQQHMIVFLPWQILDSLYAMLYMYMMPYMPFQEEEQHSNLTLVYCLLSYWNDTDKRNHTDELQMHVNVLSSAAIAELFAPFGGAQLDWALWTRERMMDGNWHAWGWVGNEFASTTLLIFWVNVPFCYVHLPLSKWRGGEVIGSCGQK